MTIVNALTRDDVSVPDFLIKSSDNALSDVAMSGLRISRAALPELPKWQFRQDLQADDRFPYLLIKGRTTQTNKLAKSDRPQMPPRPAHGWPESPALLTAVLG